MTDWCNGPAIRAADRRWAAAIKLIEAAHVTAGNPHGYCADPIAWAQRHDPELLSALSGLPVPERGIL